VGGKTEMSEERGEGGRDKRRVCRLLTDAITVEDDLEDSALKIWRGKKRGSGMGGKGAGLRGGKRMRKGV